MPTLLLPTIHKNFVRYGVHDVLGREQDGFVFNLWLARHFVGNKQVCCAGEVLGNL